MQTLVYLIVLAVISGCATGLPKPPKGSFCTHYQERNIALCNDLSSGNPESDVPMHSTDKWIMFSPDTWNNVQDYIDQLKLLIKNQGMNESSGVELRLKDIEKIQTHLKNIESDNSGRRL
jgi:hypothetical protein